LLEEKEKAYRDSQESSLKQLAQVKTSFEVSLSDFQTKFESSQNELKNRTAELKQIQDQQKNLEVQNANLVLALQKKTDETVS
jgi:hypothetical protein